MAICLLRLKKSKNIYAIDAKLFVKGEFECQI